MNRDETIKVAIRRLRETGYGLLANAVSHLAAEKHELFKQNTNLRGNLDIAFDNEEKLAAQLKDVAPCMTQTEADERRAKKEEDKIAWCLSELNTLRGNYERLQRYSLEDRRLRREAEAERDALAAQLDKPRIKIIGDLTRSGIDPEDITTSLARLKAEWQAEALDAIAHKAGDHIELWLRAEADKLRRQAEDPRPCD